MFQNIPEDPQRAAKAEQADSSSLASDSSVKTSIYHGSWEGGETPADNPGIIKTCSALRNIDLITL